MCGGIQGLGYRKHERASPKVSDAVQTRKQVTRGKDAAEPPFILSASYSIIPPLAAYITCRPAPGPQPRGALKYSQYTHISRPMYFLLKLTVAHPEGVGSCRSHGVLCMNISASPTQVLQCSNFAGKFTEKP